MTEQPTLEERLASPDRPTNRPQPVADRTASSAKPTVYFDGGCPVCRREVSFYRALPGAERVEWIDAADAPDDAFGPDLTRDRALNRMHVRDADGRLAEGVPAFATLWRALPWGGPLAWIASRRVLQRPLARAYDGFLVLRRRLGIGTPNKRQASS